MSLREFIRENRAELDACIRGAGARGTLNNEDREDWIMNDEGLYLWAQSAGCKI